MRSFNKTVAGKMANSVSVGMLGRRVDDLDDECVKQLLLSQSARLGREEFIAVVLALLPPGLRLAACDEYDRVCLR